MSHLNISILAFSIIFVLLKLACLVALFDLFWTSIFFKRSQCGMTFFVIFKHCVCAKRFLKYRLGFSLWWSVSSNTNWKNAAPTKTDQNLSDYTWQLQFNPTFANLCFNFKNQSISWRKKILRCSSSSPKVATTVKGH